MARHNCYEEPISERCQKRMNGYKEGDENDVKIIDYALLRVYVKKRLQEEYMPIGRLAESVGVNHIAIRGFLSRGAALSVRLINKVIYILDGTIEGYEQFKRENK